MRILIVMIILLSSAAMHAQETQSSEEKKYVRDFGELEYLYSTDQHSIYASEDAEGNYEIIKYGSDGVQQLRQALDFDASKETGFMVEDLFYSDRVQVLVSYIQESKRIWMLGTINSEGQMSGNLRKVADRPINSNLKTNTFIDHDPVENLLLVCISESNEADGSTESFLHTLYTDGRWNSQGTTNTQLYEHSAILENVYLAPSGNQYLGFRLSDKEGKEYISVQKVGEENTGNLPVYLSEAEIVDYAIQEKTNGQVVMLGFYTTENTKGIAGSFSLPLDFKQDKLGEPVLAGLDVMYTLENINLKNTNGQVGKDLSIKLNSISHDGKFYLIAENVGVTSNTRSDFSDEDGPKKIKTNFFQYRDVIVAKFDWSEEAPVNDILRKNQFLNEQLIQYGSYQPLILEDQLTIFYPGENKNGDHAICWSTFGKFSEKKMISFESNHRALPGSVHVNGSDTNVLLRNGKKERWLKIKTL